MVGREAQNNNQSRRKTNETVVKGGSKVDIEEIKKMDHKKKVRMGLIMAIFCALFWGIWYVPGYGVWDQPVMTELGANLGAYGGGMSESTVAILQAVFLTGINAIACALVLFIWNGGLGKIKELKRTTVQFQCASKYFMLAGLCGACAVSGTYLASTFISPGFAAISGLLYPIIGTIMSVLYLKQKVSMRGYIGITVLLIGGITMYSGTLISGGMGSNIVGIIGGIMAAVGWGFEGVVAGKALDICEPDVGLHLRFIFEAMIWIIILVVLAIIGYPMFSTMGLLLDPATIVIVILLGLSFAWCYVTWYKSFPFLGVARGQAVGSLYAACAVIFLTIFFGPAYALGYTDDTMVLIVGSTIAGLLICLVGSFLLATENSEDMVCLKQDTEDE